jgi:plastocyanin
LVGLGEGVNLFSPDVDHGQTGTYEWTAPATPGTYKVVCAYHPAMTFSLVVE